MFCRLYLSLWLILNNLREINTQQAAQISNLEQENESLRSRLASLESAVVALQTANQ